MSQTIIKWLITRQVAKYETEIANKEFHPEIYYVAVIMSCAHIKVNLESAEQISSLWRRKHQTILNQDSRTEQIIDGYIKSHITTDMVYIHQYLELTKDIDVEQDDKKNLWHKKAVGVPDYTYSE